MFKSSTSFEFVEYAEKVSSWGFQVIRTAGLLGALVINRESGEGPTDVKPKTTTGFQKEDGRT